MLTNYITSLIIIIILYTINLHINFAMIIIIKKIANYANPHYMLLFSKKYHTFKIKIKLLLNQPLLNNNHKKIKFNYKEDIEINNNIKENLLLDNDKEDINFKNIINYKIDIKTEIDNKNDTYNINIELIDFYKLSIHDKIANMLKMIKNKVFQANGFFCPQRVPKKMKVTTLR